MLFRSPVEQAGRLRTSLLSDVLDRAGRRRQCLAPDIVPLSGTRLEGRVPVRHRARGRPGRDALRRLLQVLSAVAEKASCESEFRAAVAAGMPPSEAYDRFGVL